MFDKEKIGKRVAAIRKARELTQEQLVELIGDENISLSTLKRIESGRVAPDSNRLKQLTQALACDLRDMVEEDGRRAELLESFKKNQDEDEENNPTDIEKEVANIIARQKHDYPEKPKQLYYHRFHINNLLQFIVYLPLMDHALLMDVLEHIAGDLFDRDFYMHTQLERLYTRIPDSGAKAFADFMASLCTSENFMEYHVTGINEAENNWFSLKLEQADEETLDCVWAEEVRLYDAYMQMLRDKKNSRTCISGLLTKEWSGAD